MKWSWRLLYTPYNPFSDTPLAAKIPRRLYREKSIFPTVFYRGSYNPLQPMVSTGGRESKNGNVTFLDARRKPIPS